MVMLHTSIMYAYIHSCSFICPSKHTWIYSFPAKICLCLHISSYVYKNKHRCMHMTWFRTKYLQPDAGYTWVHVYVDGYKYEWPFVGQLYMHRVMWVHEYMHALLRLIFLLYTQTFIFAHFWIFVYMCILWSFYSLIQCLFKTDL